MTVILHRPVGPDDAKDLVARLRAADKLELLLAHGPDILRHLENSIEVSDLERSAVLIDGRVEAIYGLASGGEFNVPWMLGSDEVMKHKRALLVLGRATLRWWADRFDTPLKNLVLKVNDAHVNWLRHIGCSLDREVRCGPLNSAFIEFNYV